MHTTRTAFLLAVFLSLAIVACSPSEEAPTGDAMDTASSAMNGSDAMDEPIVVDRMERTSTAAGIVDALARQDWQMLSTMVAPSGVRFTPYTHVNVQTDQTFSPADIAAFGSDQTVKNWGIQEGSGEPILLTNMQYVDRYLWDHDYRTASDVRWNAIQDHGSMIDNVQDVYPGATVVEYHFPGFDPQYGGLDWRSLRLVLAQGDTGEWVLHGIIHDEWTP